MNRMSLNKLSYIPALSDNLDAISKSYMESYVYSYINDNFLELVVWEYYTDKGICMYQIDWDLSSKEIYDSSRTVSVLYDQTFSKLDSNQFYTLI